MTASYLKTSHIARVSSVFEAVLIALHEEFQEKPATQATLEYSHNAKPVLI